MGGSDELTVLGEEFNDLTERLQTSERKRSQFVSDASHELKTPLASIKLLTDSILQNNMDMDTVKEFVADIGNEADRLNRMTAKLLSLAKAENPQPQESEIIYMAPTVQRVAKMLRTNASWSGVTFCLELDEDTPVLILEDDLYQIVFNLMENGIKYNLPGGTLTVHLGRQEDNAVLTVSDTGMGIPEDALAHIFRAVLPGGQGPFPEKRRQRTGACHRPHHCPAQPGRNFRFQYGGQGFRLYRHLPRL